MKHLFPKQNRQDGVAILLAVMMVAGITIITSTVAYFVIQEIRSSRASALTEPAIIAAETAGEQGVFTVKRSSFNTSCGSASFTQIDGTTTANSSTRIRKCITSLPATFQIDSTQPLVFYLYDPNNVNGNTCMENDPVCPVDGAGLGSQLFSSVIIKYLSGSFPITVAAETLDKVALSTGAYSNMTPGTTGTIPIPSNIISSNDERLRFTLTATTGTATVEISTTGLYTGLPDYQTVDAEGCQALTSIANCDSTGEVYKRRINITLPK